MIGHSEEGDPLPRRTALTCLLVDVDLVAQLEDLVELIQLVPSHGVAGDVRHYEQHPLLILLLGLGDTVALEIHSL